MLNKIFNFLTNKQNKSYQNMNQLAYFAYKESSCSEDLYRTNNTQNQLLYTAASVATREKKKPKC